MVIIRCRFKRSRYLPQVRAFYGFRIEEILPRSRCACPFLVTGLAVGEAIEEFVIVANCTCLLVIVAFAISEPEKPSLDSAP